MTGRTAVIRQATVEDAQRLHELHTLAVLRLCSDYYAPEIIRGWLAGRSAGGYLDGIRSGAIFVAEIHSKVVGFGEAIPGEIVAVYVDPDFGKRGVGAALLNHGVRLASAGRGGTVRLESTLIAVGFYERFGFTELERSVVHRNDVEVPIVVMARSGG